jgi:hypothetical protein
MPLLLFLFVFTLTASYTYFHGPSDRPTQEDTHHD